MSSALLEPVLDAASEGLEASIDALELEQAPHGLESWTEQQLRGAVALRLAGRYAVSTEVRYPHAATRRGWRCDLVVGDGDQALWLELKRLEEGMRWSRQLGASVSEDAVRLASDHEIPSRALLLFAFVNDREGARASLDAWRRGLAAEQVDVLPALQRALPIADRRGLTTLLVWLVPVLPRARHLPPVVLRR